MDSEGGIVQQAKWERIPDGKAITSAASLPLRLERGKSCVKKLRERRGDDPSLAVRCERPATSTEFCR